MNLDEILDAIYLLPKDSKAKLRDLVTEVTFPKGHILLREEKVERSIYFIKKGIVRAFSIKPEKEHTFWFGSEGETAMSMQSYINDLKGYESIQLLEYSELYKLNTAALKKLFSEDIHISNWGRRFAELELVKTEERLISQQFHTALERYTVLVASNPDLIQRVQLGLIASYLGITQVSLSRIRAELK
ncbi:Crp/Fnr family transcriptional regulator [Pedobacter caeni]|uniref:cAMP-binding domain of CRP or a regulatory subunit of cAMP-dependent protein kinases n=1 Tax=Pedobacter caeni TaxID=288992 RepID=A0A1M5KXH5_9SPHI|nr:Crp/Fnr family transcriptional regulator [Pedobacter caeni]SHG57370.1 cAMP-binding domain of CRP or a regulatory subunit of cAMP-dependent protein kinases [Pedobacter caeni]